MAGQAAGLPCALTQTPAQFVDDPQPRARGFFIPSSPVGPESVPLPGAPFVSVPPLLGYRRSAPRLGEDNEEMYVRELGYSARDLENWRIDGLL